MSIRIMDAVWRTSERRGAELLVLLALADWCNDRGECDPSYSQLADKARIDRRRAIRIVETLIEAGEVVKSGAGFEFAPGRVSNRLVLTKYTEDATTSSATSGARATSTSGARTTSRVAPVPPPTVILNDSAQRSASTDAALRAAARPQQHPTAPTGSADGSRWAPFYALAAAHWGEEPRTRDGTTRAHYGRMALAFGRWADDDPDLACRLFQAWAASGAAKYAQQPTLAPPKMAAWLTENGDAALADIVAVER